MASTITAGNATNNGTSISSDNTGILQIKTGTGSGTTVMTLDAVGAVGIGTASPSYPLDVTGTTRLNGVVGINGTPVTTASLLVSQGGADFTLGTNYATFFSGNGYSGGIALNATSMQIGQNSATRSLTFHSGTSFAERMRIDASGNINIATAGARITGDFSNATVANRVMFQNNVTDAASRVAILPNGTSTSASIDAFNNSNPTNASLLRLGPTSTDCRVEATITGTGTLLPMTFYTGGSERMRIDTSGNVGIGTAPVANIRFNTLSGAGVTSLYALGPAGSLIVDFLGGGLNYLNGSTTQFRNFGGTIVTLDITQGTGVLVKEAVGLGYGTGSGGTVTQGTSRTTGVTLNRPAGAITMFSAAGSATAATFTVTNSIVAITDTIKLSQRSGTNLYNFIVTAVAAGSFNITFFTTGGTATDAPVINFAVIKGATS